MERAEWWRQMFTTSLWQAVQLSWEEADDADEDAALVARALELAPGSRVFDAPCGTGRIATRLRAAGHHAVGLDATPRFLSVAAAAGLPVVCADMRTTVTRPSSFDAAFCVWGSFGYFDDDGNRAQARALATALRPGGPCLIDTLVADTLLPHFEPRAAWDVGDVHVEEARRYDEVARRIETTWSFSRGSERATQVTRIRLYTLAELTDLLADVGFASFRAMDGELRPFGERSERLWLVATRAD